MSNDFTRRELLKSWGLMVGAGAVAPQLVFAEVSKSTPSSKTDSLIRLSLNENPYGPSSDFGTRSAASLVREGASCFLMRDGRNRYWQLRCVSEVSILDGRILRTPTGLGSRLVCRWRIFVLKMPSGRVSRKPRVDLALSYFD